MPLDITGPIQVDVLLYYLARFGDEVLPPRCAWEPYFDIWAIFNLLQLFLLYFYNLYTRSEYQDYLDILESVVKAVSLGTVAMAFFARAFALPRSIVMAPGPPTPSCSAAGAGPPSCQAKGGPSPNEP